MIKRNLQKMTLNKIWSECERMWKWIANEIAKQSSTIDPDNMPDVVCRLKNKWLGQEGYIGLNHPYHGCFFCERAEKDEYGDVDCKTCPGCSVDKQFHCMNDSYLFDFEPRMFYKKIVQMNKKRKAKK